MYELFKILTTVNTVKNHRLKYLGHAMKLFDGKPGRRKLAGRPRKRWLQDVKEIYECWE